MPSSTLLMGRAGEKQTLPQRVEVLAVLVQTWRTPGHRGGDASTTRRQLATEIEDCVSPNHDRDFALLDTFFGPLWEGPTTELAG
jgi:hypothetical protein